MQIAGKKPNSMIKKAPHICAQHFIEKSHTNYFLYHSKYYYQPKRTTEQNIFNVLSYYIIIFRDNNFRLHSLSGDFVPLSNFSHSLYPSLNIFISFYLVIMFTSIFINSNLFLEILYFMILWKYASDFYKIVTQMKTYSRFVGVVFWNFFHFWFFKLIIFTFWTQINQHIRKYELFKKCLSH